MWRDENDNGMSSANRSLLIDTSRRNLGKSDFGFPEDAPDFKSHRDVLHHLKGYAERFGVRDHAGSARELRRSAPPRAAAATPA